MSGNDVVIDVCKVTNSPSVVNEGFAHTRTNQFMVNGKPLYLNGFNAYWLMCMASDPTTKTKVTDAFQEASKTGMNLVRTWAFSDGGSNPLQTAPGLYNEDMFKGLDFVISQAKIYNLRLILSLVNNWDDFGGKKQYVQWARDHGGQNLESDDDFFSNVVVREYYKNHVKSVLTRRNSITGVAYKDDPTIFAWELINEPRCETDLSGKILEEWIEEMATEIKSIDKNHLLECGLEGFYGESMPDKKQNNPGFEVGTDFISNNLINNVDFATIHIYPDQWVSGDEEDQTEFAEKWIQSHIDDCNSVLRKPLLITEFGKSSWSRGYTTKQRDDYFRKIFNTAYKSAKSGGSCTGTMFWQVMAKGMENWGDGYQVVLEKNTSTAALISQQSQKLLSVNSSMKMQLFSKQKDKYFGSISNTDYESAKNSGLCSDNIFWQFMAKGMENLCDSYQVVSERNPSAAPLIFQQSQKNLSLDSSMKTQLQKFIIDFLKITILGVILLIFILQAMKFIVSKT